MNQINQDQNQDPTFENSNNSNNFHPIFKLLRNKYDEHFCLIDKSKTSGMHIMENLFTHKCTPNHLIYRTMKHAV